MARQFRYDRLAIPRSILDAMIAHARRELPNESCGLLAGSIEGDTGRVTQHFSIRNDLASPTEYLTSARDLLDAMKAVRAAGTDVLAIYHSHPTSEPVPSRKDIERNEWGDAAAHVIVGLQGEEPDVRAWWIGEGPARTPGRDPQVPIDITPA
jgi:proteasome lid subunit RPN8/RPN11